MAATPLHRAVEDQGGVRFPRGRDAPSKRRPPPLGPAFSYGTTCTGGPRREPRPRPSSRRSRRHPRRGHQAVESACLSRPPSTAHRRDSPRRRSLRCIWLAWSRCSECCRWRIHAYRAGLAPDRRTPVAGKQLHEIPVRVSDERDPQSGLGRVAGRPDRAAARLHRTRVGGVEVIDCPGCVGDGRRLAPRSGCPRQRVEHPLRAARGRSPVIDGRRSARRAGFRSTRQVLLARVPAGLGPSVNELRCFR